MNLKDKILEKVNKIKTGEFKTYKEIAQLIKRPKAYRVVGNILAKNRDLKIPCHRVIKNNHTIGGYFGSNKNSWLKLAKLLKEGVIAVIPTDTIYGICGSALNKKAVEKIYKLKKRSFKKPMIILVSSLNELKTFGINLSKQKRRILKKIWPGKISVILKIKNKKKAKKFKYLHRETNYLAFRIPKSKLLIKILKISGPLIAPSANLEDRPPAATISEAKKYFKDKVAYYNGGKIIAKPSTLIRFENGKIKIVRKGEEINKINKIKKFINIIDK